VTQKYEIDFGGRPLSFEVGRLAGQADGAVLVRYGDTVVLAAVTGSREPREGADFFPLTVDYEERMYAAGKIPGNFFRREARPPEASILTMRLTDRPLRPLFPKDFRNEVQIIITAMSYDEDNDPDILCIIGASAALMISPIPFDGPVGAVRVGYVNGKYVLNPSKAQMAQTQLDLVIAGTADAGVNMLEAGAQQVSEDVCVEGIRWGYEQMQPVLELQKKMRAEIGKEKFSYPSFGASHELHDKVKKLVGNRIDKVLDTQEKHPRAAASREIVKSVHEQLADPEVSSKTVATIVEEVEAEALRERILKGGKRPDGRGLEDLRPLTAEVGILPRTHGSAIFQRGETQVLSIATLGSTADEQQIDSLGAEGSKRYLHHYNMPPYSVGEVRRTGSPGRREIGHGALAERALMPVIPPKDQFPYTLRVVSEVVSSNGSTSMASVCGSTLSLMDAGVPISAPVGGISIGLVTSEDGKQQALLTDIQGIEDHHGDMDFKVAGTEAGVTAIQLDLKIRGLQTSLMADIFKRAREARMKILAVMNEAIGTVRPELSQYAPRVLKTTIPVDKIGQLIGPGGKNIRGLQDQYKVKIDVEEDGTVFIAGVDGPAAEMALKSVAALGKDVEIGETYMGKVTRLTNFGAFVEILPGKDGLVRLGELSDERVARVEDVVSIGDEIMVKVIEIDPQGRVNLSRRAVLTGEEAPAGGGGGGGGFGGGRPSFGDRPPRRDFGDRPPPRRDFGDRPPPRAGGFRDRPPMGDRPPRRDAPEPREPR
jgi:polyribonucleotide nucleotidyltransferase